MKRLVLIAVIVFMLIPSPVFAENEYDVHIFGEKVYNDAADKIMSGDFSLNPSEILNSLIKNVTKEIRQSGRDIAIMLIIAALSGVASMMSSSFGKSGGDAVFLTCFTIMSISALNCFFSAMNYGFGIIDTMNTFINKLSPLFMMLLISGGYTVTAAAFHPVLTGAVYAVSIIIEKCIMPLCCFSAVLAVAGNMSERIQLSRFCMLVKSASKWIMTAVFTIFTGISSIYGFSSPPMDALAGKTVKFAVGSLVPVVGGFLSDTIETVIGGTRLMKNAIGTAGIIAIIFICIAPIIKVGIIQLILKLTAALTEPLTDGRISKMIWEVSEAVTNVFAIMILTAVLFIINLAIIMAATSV